MKEKDYLLRLTQEDKVKVHFKKNKGKITHFIIQYYALIDARWRTIMRIDTCHGYAHKHTFHAKDKQHVVRLPGNLNNVFTQSREIILNDFLKIKENYLQAK